MKASSAGRRSWPLAISAAAIFITTQFATPQAHAAAVPVRLELNKVDQAENRCRLTFVMENRASQIVESLKLDLAVFDPAGVVGNRLVIEMGPLRAGRTIVRTFSVDGDCKQVGSILINEVAACAPGDAESCLDAIDLSSRAKGIRFHK